MVVDVAHGLTLILDKSHLPCLPYPEGKSTTGSTSLFSFIGSFVRASELTGL